MKFHAIIHFANVNETVNLGNLLVHVPAHEDFLQLPNFVHVLSKTCSFKRCLLCRIKQSILHKIKEIVMGLQKNMH